MSRYPAKIATPFVGDLVGYSRGCARQPDRQYAAQSESINRRAWQVYKILHP
jgi:hypothetical protein